jgi:hypothetical protein
MTIKGKHPRGRTKLRWEKQDMKHATQKIKKTTEEAEKKLWEDKYTDEMWLTKQPR